MPCGQLGPLRPIHAFLMLLLSGHRQRHCPRRFPRLHSGFCFGVFPALHPTPAQKRTILFHRTAGFGKVLFSALQPVFPMWADACSSYLNTFRSSGVRPASIHLRIRYSHGRHARPPDFCSSGSTLKPWLLGTVTPSSPPSVASSSLSSSLRKGNPLPKKTRRQGSLPFKVVVV